MATPLYRRWSINLDQVNPQSLSLFVSLLPVEIKIMIYVLLLVSNEPVKTIQTEKNRFRMPKGIVGANLPPPRKRLSAQIIRICKCIYLQSLGVLYGHNEFQFDGVARPHRFLCRLSHHAFNALRALDLGIWASKDTPDSTDPMVEHIYEMLAACQGLQVLKLYLSPACYGAYKRKNVTENLPQAENLDADYDPQIEITHPAIRVQGLHELHFQRSPSLTQTLHSIEFRKAFETQLRQIMTQRRED